MPDDGRVYERKCSGCGRRFETSSEFQSRCDSCLSLDDELETRHNSEDETTKHRRENEDEALRKRFHVDEE